MAAARKPAQKTGIDQLDKPAGSGHVDDEPEDRDEGDPTDEILEGEEEPGVVDLLKLIDVSRDRLVGDWRLENGKLRTVNAKTGGPEGALLKIPYRISGDYSLRMKVRRTGRSAPVEASGIAVPIVRGSERLSMYLSGGWKGSRLMELESQTEPVDFLPSAMRFTITCAVAGDGFTVSNNAGVRIDRQGVFGKSKPETGEIPDGWLFLRVWGDYEFGALALSPASLIDDPGDQSPLGSTGSAAARGVLASAAAWYRAEGNAHDSAGDHDGELDAGVAITPIKIGQAFDFEGQHGSVVVPDAKELNPPRQFTLMAWICPRSWGGRDGNGRPSAALAKASQSGANGFRLEASPEGLFAQFHSPGTARTIHEVRAAPLPFALGEWAHVAATYNGGDFVLYKNGAPVGGTPIGQKDVAATDGTLAIRGQGFDGLIDDVALFDRALNRAEIKSAYRGTVADKSWYEPIAVVATSQDAPTTWSYSTVQPPENWARNDFDDSSWARAPGAFGGDYPAVRTEWMTSDIWMRRQFELPGTDAVAPLLNYPRLVVSHDDDAEVYLNGVLAAKLPAAAVGNVRPASPVVTAAARSALSSRARCSSGSNTSREIGMARCASPTSRRCSRKLNGNIFSTELSRARASRSERSTSMPRTSCMPCDWSSCASKPTAGSTRATGT